MTPSRSVSLLPEPAEGTNKPAPKANVVKRFGLIAATVALIAITLLPATASLPRAGQVMLAILAFAVIVWMTEALDYAVSAVVIGALMVFLLAYSPDAAKPLGADMGTGAALGLALSGFSNSAVALVAAACFIAAAMTATGLDRRIALFFVCVVQGRCQDQSHRDRRNGRWLSVVIYCAQHHRAGGLPGAHHDGIHPGLQG